MGRQNLLTIVLLVLSGIAEVELIEKVIKI